MKSIADIKYQGRPALRRGSERRRQAILDAALRVIVRDGIRAVRHRAVAQEAGVPLSATTYYFKDIPDLIVDTFTLFAERAMEDIIAPFRDSVFEQLTRLAPQASQSAAARASLVELLAQMTCDFIFQEVEQQRDHLIAEQAFFAESAIEPRLVELCLLYVGKQQESLSDACRLLGSADPVCDGDILISVIHRIERQLLVAGVIDAARVKARLKRTLDLLVPDFVAET